MEKEIEMEMNLRANYNKYLREILIGLDETSEVIFFVEMFVKIIQRYRIPMYSTKLVIQKIKNILLSNFIDSLVELWSQIVIIYEDFILLDDFIDMYSMMSEKSIFICKIKEMKNTFGFYYIKFIKDFKKNREFDEMVGELENECNNFVSKSIFI
ncbi:hypothetical protein CWI39_0059p0050 [Hamiltosporidium magnivora]|uniref:Uncharacterized protein n=1 Tax=Hamiltosporidium magnivora TaxID=148818 RepID=A0A4Q9LN74_9MICR|nr:hypothetical protein CWI39_0059p0050 [Hamiltosporidium magnivora]